MKYLAHISEDKQREQSIKSHLEETALLAKEFAEEFLESGAVFQVQLEEEIEPRAMGYCTQRSAPLSFAAQKFIDIIK